MEEIEARKPGADVSPEASATQAGEGGQLVDRWSLAVGRWPKLFRCRRVVGAVVVAKKNSTHTDFANDQRPKANDSFSNSASSW